MKKGKNEAKEHLLRIRMLDELISNKRWELEQLRGAAYSMTAHAETVTINGEQHIMDKVQSSGSQQRMADAVCGYLDVADGMQAEIAAWEREKQRIISIIQPLPEMEYKLLHRVYVRGMDLREVAAEFDRSYSWSTTVHGIALKNVQKALDKAKEGA